MAPSPIQILWLGENNLHPSTKKLLTWDYFHDRLQVDGAKRTNGAFRAFSVADLLQPQAVIRLSEWKDLRHGEDVAEHHTNYPRYVAISHVWEESEDTIRIADKKERPLKIKIEDKPVVKYKTISWYGLVQAANAANMLGCQYIWLDFLCLDQLSPRDQNDRDKAMQIANMANIYKHAAAVICMLGGVSAVQGADQETAWMDRAWTLQEAMINWTNTWAYLRFPPLWDIFSMWEDDIQPVPNEPGKYLIKLDKLLDLKAVEHLLPTSYNVVCLDGKKYTKRGRTAAKNAMLSYFRAKSPQLRLAGVWRAMLLRTSTKPVDIVYSVMGLFNLKLNPYSEDYDLQYLFNDLARKAAAVGSSRGYGMEWLCIGGVQGSIGRLQRDDSSFLIPKVPNYAKAHNAPRYFVGDNSKSSGDLVDHSRIAISQYHIKFYTDSQPHIICAPMLKVKNVKPIPPAKGTTVKDARIDLGDMKGLHCRYHGKIDSDTVIAVMVGTVGTWDDARDKLIGQQFVMFIKWTKVGWKLVGDGVVPVKEVKVNGVSRMHFTMGIGSQRDLESWSCDHLNLKFWDKPLPRSYGVLPLENYAAPNDRGWEVVWFGQKDQQPPTKEDRQKVFVVFLREEPPMIRTQHFTKPSNQISSELLSQPIRRPLWFVSSTLEDPPTGMLRNRSSRLLGHVNLELELTDVSLSNAGDKAQNEALTKGHKDARVYWVEVRFTRFMIYLSSAPNQEQLEENPLFTKTVVASYKPRLENVRVLNEKYYTGP